jgi:hypothetical protein
MNRDTLRLLGGSLCLGVAFFLFVFGPLPTAEALYRHGLWPRLTPEELQAELKQRYKITVTRCEEGTNGWDYICWRPPERAKRTDKLGVQGSPFGVGSWVELRPGPVPSREEYRTRAKPR